MTCLTAYIGSCFLRPHMWMPGNTHVCKKSVHLFSISFTGLTHLTLSLIHFYFCKVCQSISFPDVSVLFTFYQWEEVDGKISNYHASYGISNEDQTNTISLIYPSECSAAWLTRIATGGHWRRIILNHTVLRIPMILAIACLMCITMYFQQSSQ